jgi:hypothetical protein
MSAIILLFALWLGASVFLLWAFSRRLWLTSALPSRLYLVAGWSLVSIGIIQAAYSAFKFSSFDETALWFATAGMGISLTGALNLLNLGRRCQDIGLRRVCFAANVCVTVMFVAVATHRGAEPPHDPVSVSFIAVGTAATLLSRRVPLHRGRVSNTNQVME